MKEFFYKYGVEILVFMTLFFEPIATIIWAVGSLIIFDTLTGIWAAIHKGGWKEFTSTKFKRVIPKLLLYPLVIIVAQIAENYLLEQIPWVKVSLGLLAAVEVKSIYENTSVILGFDIWNKFQDRIIKFRAEDILPDKKKKEDDR